MNKNKKEQKTILVTGGAGLIGSHLIEELLKDEKNNVISLDNYFIGKKENHIEGAKYIEGHTKDIEKLISEKIDLVFHLGEYSRVEQSFGDVELVWDLNIQGTFRVLEFCRKNACKIVYAGSSTKFADGGMGRDQSPYAWMKATNTDLVRRYGEWFDLPYAITYFYNVFGDRELSEGEYASVMGKFKTLFKGGEDISVVSPGTQLRNFTHVKDIVAGLIHVGEKGKGDGYGIGNDEAISIRDFAELFTDKIKMLPKRGGNRMTAKVESSKTKKEFGWEAKHSVKDYIKKIVDEINYYKKIGLPVKQILVFTTTYYPDMGPAEKALDDLIQETPETEFHIITTKFRKGLQKVENRKNMIIYRVGVGSHMDKYLLPILGSVKALRLNRQNKYSFVWSVMASYGAVPAFLLTRVNKQTKHIMFRDKNEANRKNLMKKIADIFVRNANTVYEQGKDNKESLLVQVKKDHTKLFKK